jgi:hypothetical protein
MHRLLIILDIFTLISLSNFVNINKLILILKISGWCDVTDKSTTSVLKVLTYITTSITTIGLAVILLIMSVSTFTIAVILTQV